MKTSEAIEVVETYAASNIKVRDYSGEPFLPCELVALATRHAGQDWTATENAFETGQITPDEYCRRAVTMLQGFERIVQRGRVEKALARLQKGRQTA